LCIIINIAGFSCLSETKLPLTFLNKKVEQPKLEPPVNNSVAVKEAVDNNSVAVKEAVSVPNTTVETKNANQNESTELKKTSKSVSPTLSYLTEDDPYDFNSELRSSMDFDIQKAIVESEKQFKRDEAKRKEEQDVEAAIAASLVDVEQENVPSKAEPISAALAQSKTAYRLHSIVSHVGETMSSGHYITFGCDLKTNMWKKYNDETTQDIKEEDVLGSLRQKTCYVFFYVNTQAVVM